MLLQRIIIATGLLAVLFPFKASAKNYDEIYTFGDSFSDTGNVFSATNGFIPASPTYFNGRFSNGSVWVEYLASDLGLSFNPKTNYAFGGATTGSQNIGLASLPGLQQQISSFTAANQSANPKALYVIWAGTNDYLSYFFGGVPNPTQTVNNISAAVQSLTSVGAKDVMVVNLPNLGYLPIAGGNNQISSLLDTFTAAHNSNLSSNLKLLQQQLSPEINIIPVDVNSLFSRIIAHPGEFGFTNVTDSCVGQLSVNPITTSTQSVPCTPDEFLFWDEVHPTTATHKLIGELAFSRLNVVSVPESSHVSSSVLGVLCFGALSKVSQRKGKDLQKSGK